MTRAADSDSDSASATDSASDIATSAYHHGDLRRTLLTAAVDTVAERGPAALSLRALAAAAGVSHAAPVHHFKNRAGLFTAVAAEGFSILADEVTAAWEASGQFLDAGVAYVHFALSHRGYFEVMFRPELFDVDDPELVVARERAYALLQGPVASGRRGTDSDSVYQAVVASWATVHGLSTLLLSGNLPGLDTMDSGELDALTRQVLGHLHVV